MFRKSAHQEFGISGLQTFGSSVFEISVSSRLQICGNSRERNLRILDLGTSRPRNVGASGLRIVGLQKIDIRDIRMKNTLSYCIMYVLYAFQELSYESSLIKSCSNILYSITTFGALGSSVTFDVLGLLDVCFFFRFSLGPDPHTNPIGPLSRLAQLLQITT